MKTAREMVVELTAERDQLRAHLKNALDQCEACGGQILELRVRAEKAEASVVALHAALKQAGDDLALAYGTKLSGAIEKALTEALPFVTDADH